jgi:hypothetical protein
VTAYIEAFVLPSNVKPDNTNSLSHSKKGCPCAAGWNHLDQRRKRLQCELTCKIFLFCYYIDDADGSRQQHKSQRRWRCGKTAHVGGEKCVIKAHTCNALASRLAQQNALQQPLVSRQTAKTSTTKTNAVGGQATANSDHNRQNKKDEILGCTIPTIINKQL